MTRPGAELGSVHTAAQAAADAAAAEEFVRSLLEARIGPVARGIASDEPFADVGVSSIDLVFVVAAIERDSGADESAEFAQVARCFATLTAYYRALRELP
jgi:hypothetical protein